MPSLHFATSLLAAILLAETGALAGAVGWAYARTLGFALVYLGEHYADRPDRGRGPRRRRAAGRAARRARSRSGSAPGAAARADREQLKPAAAVFADAG